MTSPNALDYRAFRFYWAAVICAGFAVQITSVAVAWQVYDITGDPLYLGLVGLSQFLPPLCFVLVTGLVADRFDRRLVMRLCLVLEALCGVALIAFTLSSPTLIWPVFAILAAFGLARGFYNPAADALSPNVVPAVAIPNGISLTNMGWQATTICGPVAGGLLYGISAIVPYCASLALVFAAMLLITAIGPIPQQSPSDAPSLKTMLAGFAFIRKERIVLGAISLDLFAVLLGGAVALMPVFARDILVVGPWGLGLLRAAPGIGAIAMALWLARHPVKDNAGLVLFGWVAGFGLFTMVFGLSTWVPLSIAALVIMGAADMVSVYVRETLLQLRTPDEVRGRVNAVNRVFIGASNELGEFRAGFVAAWIGAIPAVVIGGAGTMAIAALWAKLFPEIRRARRLDGRTD